MKIKYFIYSGAQIFFTDSKSPCFQNCKNMGGLNYTEHNFMILKLSMLPQSHPKGPGITTLA